MKQLNADIKSGELKQVYLLYGEEGYLKKQYRDRLRKAAVGEGDSMNLSAFEGKGIDVQAVIESADTMPFFAERRLILIENSGFFKKAQPRLAEYIEKIPDTACMVFVEEEVDKRGKLYKAVSKKGYASEMKRQSDRTLLTWILGLVKKEGKRMEERDAMYLLQTAGDDMENLQRELEKLFCYTMDDKIIEKKHIDEICATQVTNHIFEMVSAVAEKRREDALRYYYDLLALKEPPMRILYLLTRQFKLILAVKDLLDQHAGRAEISEKTKIRSFAVRQYERQAQFFSRPELKGILEAGADTEEAVKTGRINDRLGVEIFIVKYSSK